MTARNLGMVGLRSTSGAYLQGKYPDGQLHASNSNRSEEETWFLFEVDPANQIYGLMNWRNGKFMSKQQGGGNCVPANSTVLGNTEQWIIVNGALFGAVNAVGFKSVTDGTYLGAMSPGNDTNCGGEVAAGSPAAPPTNDSHWPGWWVIEAATTPSPGKDLWNTVGGAVQEVANNISAADIVALISKLA